MKTKVSVLEILCLGCEGSFITIIISKFPLYMFQDGHIGVTESIDRLLLIADQKQFVCNQPAIFIRRQAA